MNPFSWLAGAIRWVVVGSCVAACGSPRGPAVEGVEPTSLPARVDAVPSAVSVVAAPSSEPKDDGPPLHRTAIALAAKKPCVIRWQALSFEEEDSHWTIAGITKIATEAGGPCKAQVFYDSSNLAQPTEWQQEGLGVVIEGGQINRPQRESEGGGTLLDLNFDGYLDLCLIAATAGNGYYQLCWLFDASAGTFRRSPKLDGLHHVTVDPKSKRLMHGARAGAGHRIYQEFAWEQDDLVLMKRIEWSAEPTDDTALPPRPGHNYRIVYERKNGAMVKVNEELEPR